MHDKSTEEGRRRFLSLEINKTQTKTDKIIVSIMSETMMKGSKFVNDFRQDE
jgi:hypothetical protein